MLFTIHAFAGQTASVGLFNVVDAFVGLPVKHNDLAIKKLVGTLLLPFSVPLSSLCPPSWRLP